MRTRQTARKGKAMTYWGSEVGKSDFAAGAVGAAVLLIKERLFKDAENVISKSYPEESIAASVRCIRMIASAFPESVALHFKRKDLARARELFDRWYELVEPKLPKQRAAGIRAAALEEFAKFEEELLTKRPGQYGG